MITVEDTEVPLGYAPLTLREFHEGIGEELFNVAKGDALIEWYERDGPLLGRAWIWKDGHATPFAHMTVSDNLRVLVLWYAKHERMH